MKRIISILLVACLAVFCFATTASAASTGAVKVSSATAETGDVVTITVELGANTALACYGATLVYDASALELTGMEKGDFCAVVNTAKAFATGFNVSDVTSGTLFTATFKVLAVKGEYAVDVVFDTVGGATSNAAGEDVAMTVAAGTVTVACNHAWDAGVVTTEPGCETEGVKTFTCSKCGETKTEAIKATGHDWNWVIDKEATETEDGVKHEECSKCGAKRNEGTKIDKTGNLDDVPETGDVTYVVMFGAFAMLAAAAFVLVIARRKAVK